MLELVKSIDFIQSRNNEFFSMKKDGLLLYNKIDKLEISCRACKSKDHDIFECGRY
jgi:hypothetical protein